MATFKILCSLLSIAAVLEAAPAPPGTLPKPPAPPEPGYFFRCPMTVPDCWTDVPAPDPAGPAPVPVCEYVNVHQPDLPDDQRVFWKTDVDGLYIHAAPGTQSGSVRECEYIGPYLRYGPDSDGTVMGNPGQCLVLNTSGGPVTIEAPLSPNAGFEEVIEAGEITNNCGLYSDNKCLEAVEPRVMGIGSDPVDVDPDNQDPYISHVQCW